MIILSLVDKLGKKWSKIVKKFGGTRTEHMVKNRFNSLIIKQKKLNATIKKENKLIKLARGNLIKS